MNPTFLQCDFCHRVLISLTRFSISVVFLSLTWPATLAFGGLLFEASLRDGDYGAGAIIDTFPADGNLSNVGIVESADGVTFTSTETTGRSNALVNWMLPSGNRVSFRTAGTVSFCLKASRDTHVGGSILGDNYGFNQFHNGQGTFGASAGRLVNGAGPEDDQWVLSAASWHNNIWVAHTASSPLEYDRVYRVAFTWGSTSTHFEIWVDGEKVAEDDNLVAQGRTLPWGSTALGSATNFGLGDNHERGVDGYNSAAGVTFADIRIWDEYRAQGDTEEGCGAAFDHYMFYTTKPNREAPKFTPFGPVTLTDQFHTADYKVLKPHALGLPANKNDEGVADNVTHLEEYFIKPTKGTPSFEPLENVRITNQCNDLLLEVRKPLSLLVPTNKSVDGPVIAPNEADHNVDHFLCYQVRAQKKDDQGEPLPRFPKGMQVEVEDQFQTRRYDLTKITKLCAPVEKSGTPALLSRPQKGEPFPIAPAAVRNPENHLVCYEAKLATKFIAQDGCGPVDPADRGARLEPKQDKHDKRTGVFVHNQFGEGVLDTIGEKELCIPSGKSLPDID